MKAIVLHGPGQATVDSVLTPHPGPGSNTIQVLHAMVHNAAEALIEGTAGGYGVGRVAASGPDTTALELLRPGHLSRSEDHRGRQDGQSGCGYCRPWPRWTLLWISDPLARRIRSPWARRFFPSGGTDKSVSLVGVAMPRCPFPMVFKDLALRASWMYERTHVRALIKMAQAGVLKLGKAAGLDVIAFYPLEKMEEAPDKGLEAGALELVVIGPQ
ncbi:uncharacterized protein G6M90_00g041490 [Metarhizium brunneum]|uniref:Uncharacterized protein n=1 Tax=Metarhizium brunneum TaxID=500148 RepID=A0A7D5UTX3_9HYPO